jgi:hypothetical protein
MVLENHRPSLGPNHLILFALLLPLLAVAQAPLRFVQIVQVYGTNGVLVFTNPATGYVAIDGSSLGSTSGVPAATVHAWDNTTSNSLLGQLSISTNPNQFAASPVLTLKSGARTTNLVIVGVAGFNLSQISDMNIVAPAGYDQLYYDPGIPGWFNGPQRPIQNFSSATNLQLYTQTEIHTGGLVVDSGDIYNAGGNLIISGWGYFGSGLTNGALTPGRAVVSSASKTMVSATGTADATHYLDGTGAYSIPSGGSATPGGAFPMLQFNNSGAFAGTTNLTWDETNSVLNLSGTLSASSLNVNTLIVTNPMNSTMISNATASKVAIFGPDKLLTNSQYADSDFALAGSTNGFVKAANGTATGLSATSSVFYGSALATNFTKTDVDGWHNTNTTTTGHVDIQSGNVTASSNIVTGDLGQFKGNAAGLTNIQAAGITGTIPTITKYSTNATWNVNLPGNGNLVSITNTLGGSTAVIWLTNVVDGGYFVFRVLADGSARTVSITNASGLTLNVINTNGFSVTTLPQIPVTASKLGTLCGRAWSIAGTTNVDLWAAVQQ